MALEFPPVKYWIKDYIYIELRDMDRGLWAIVKDSSYVLNKDLEFEYESLPSSRTEDFINRTRFTLDKAWELAKYVRYEME